jgi:hypothetical protein
MGFHVASTVRCAALRSSILSLAMNTRRVEIDRVALRVDEHRMNAFGATLRAGLRGELDCFADARIGPAAADVAARVIGSAADLTVIGAEVEGATRIRVRVRFISDRLTRRPERGLD